MAAPNLTFEASGSALSAVTGFDCISVSFSSDIAYSAFECRATKAGEEYGLGKGRLIASFSATPAGTVRSFAIYDEDLLSGDGAYRISLYAQGTDGSWNDNGLFLPSGASGLRTSDSFLFLCMKGV